MGTNIIITQPNGNRVPMQNRRTATGITSAKQNWGLNAEDTVDITIESPFPQTYNIGDKITVFGRDYKLNRLPSVKKTGMHQFQYTLQFEGVQYDLFRITYDLTVDTTTNELQDVQGDTLTGNLNRFMTVLIANANRVFPGKWKLGACPDTIGDKTLTFGESDNCLSVLQNLCNESNFNVEFEIEQAKGVYTINLHERVGQTLPFVFKYGKGRGLYDLHRENVSSSNIVTRLKVYGSTENITSKYRADRLCLPGRTKGQSYIEKAEMVAKYGIFEGRKNFDNVKPSFTGSVESKVDEFSFIDTKFPFDLNAKDSNGETLYLINGVSAKIHFNTGNLAGYDFEIKSYDHATHKFSLKKTTDDRGDVFPSETSKAFQFSKDNEYKVLDIAYSSDIEAKAEAELAKLANKYYDQNCQPKVQYGLSVTKAYLQKLVGTNDSIMNFFAPGDFLHVVDADIDVDKAIRIKSFVRNILDPYDYTLTISDITTNATITNRVISDLVELDKIVTINNLKDPIRARANWRSSREVMNMVFDPEGDYYTDKIKPGSIDTLALSVGAKSMQFGLLNTVFQPNYNGNSQLVKWQGGVLTHYAIKEEMAVSWVMADGQVTLTENNSAYYLYAKCERNGKAGLFIFTKSQIRVEEDANYYHFLVGTLSSVDPELKARSLALTYGFTMVNGRFIKTGRIESADSTTYFDLDKSEIGGVIRFKSGTTGYENIKDKPDLSIYGTKTMLNSVRDLLQNQIDNKVETYYQSSNPWQSWPSGEEPSHVGDMWYNTSTGVLQTYVGPSSNTWREIVDKSAIDAARKIAEEADAKADGKRRVFLSTPRPPYDYGDQWISGYGSTSGTMRVCVQSRQSGTYYSSDWQITSQDGNTQASVDRGIMSAAGFITFGGSAGMAGSGSIRIWSGGNSANNATFKVYSDGSVESNGMITAYSSIKLRDNQAGVTGIGTDATSVRFWAGSSSPASAPFRVQRNGKVFGTDCDFSGGKIGRFTISSNGRLTWNQNDYFGNRSTSLKLGFSTGNEGVIDISFNAGQEGKFGVKSVGGNLGGAAIYGSKYISPQNYPDSNSTYAGYFDGPVLATSLMTRADGKNWTGVSFDKNKDLDKVRFTVRNGLIVELWKE